MTVLDQHERIHPSPVPSVGRDLVESAAALAGNDVPMERVLATLELLRHGEITLDQAASFAGQSRERLARLMQRFKMAA